MPLILVDLFHKLFYKSISNVNLYLVVKYYISICDNWGWITVTVKVKLMLTLIVPGDLEGFCDIFSSILSTEEKTSGSICDNWSFIKEG